MVDEATEVKNAAVDTAVSRVLKPMTAAGGSVYLFSVEADAEPDVFARIANVFNIANTAPHHASLRRDSPDTVRVTVAIVLSEANICEMIRRKLEQLTSTISVEVVRCDLD